MLLSLFEWVEGSALAGAMLNSAYPLPVAMAVHLLGLCVLGGALIVVDLRMLGFGLTQRSIAQVADDVRPWLLGGIWVMLGTGVLLFFGEAIKCYYNTSFWVKITTLPVALAFTFTVRARVAQAGGLEVTNESRLVGVTSLVLWFTVAAAGRWIGYS